VIAATAAQGETTMIDLNNEINEATATAAAKAPEAGKKKATPGARAPRVAKSGAKATRKATSAKSAPKTALKAKGAKAPKAAEAKTARAGSKTETILGLLKRPGGVTLKELMKQTAWQAHSVRGFLSAVVGKKMKLTVASTKAENGERTYSLTS